ncbi:MAG: amidohydrolase [Burkholderiales bacterium]|nr:amidohydrolase [Burkholderiales bacterium]
MPEPNHTSPNAQSSTDAAPRPYRRVIDAHVHWYPQAFVDLMVRKGPSHGAVMGEDAKGNPVVVSVPGCTQKSNMRKTMTNLDDIIADMDKRKVDAYALSMTNPLVYWAPAGFGLELAAAHNDACVDAHRKYPDRFYGCIVLPMQDVRLAAQELERMAKHACMRAVFIAEHIEGKNLHEREFWPIYECAEALGLPLFLTNLYPTGAERMKDFFMLNTLGNPQEAGYAATSLVCGGVLDAFPNLEVFLPHAGGTFPWLVGRLDLGIAVSPELEHMKKPASEYLRRFHYDLITHHAQIMRNLIDLVGADRIVAGTDFPQAMSVKQPVDFVESIPGLTQREREMILCENPARLLQIQP